MTEDFKYHVAEEQRKGVCENEKYLIRSEVFLSVNTLILTGRPHIGVSNAHSNSSSTVSSPNSFLLQNEYILSESVLKANSEGCFSLCKVFCKTFKVSSPETECHIISSFVDKVEMLLCQIPKHFVSFSDITLASPKEKLFCVSILNSYGIKPAEQNFLKYSYDISYLCRV